MMNYNEHISSNIEIKIISKKRKAVDLKIGDTVHVEGHEGIVTKVYHEVRDGVPCTYFTASFEDDLKGTRYDGGYYGSSDEHFDF